MAEYKAKERHALMWYACKCGHRERIWNSRNGVTPFGLMCPSCGQLDLYHVDWQKDECSPEHKLHRGQRFFRDGTPEDAVTIIQRRIVSSKKAKQSVPDEIATKLLHDAENGTGEWDHKGWPMLDIYLGE